MIELRATVPGAMMCRATIPEGVRVREAVDVEPVSELGFWFYNGLPYPELPEYDQSVYRYAVLIGDSGGNLRTYPTRLIVSTTPLKYVNNAAKWNLMYGTDSGSCIGFEWSGDGTVAYSHGFIRNESLDNSFSTNGGAVSKGVVNDLLWANYNVRSFTDDSLLLSASSPVPDKDPVAYLYNGIRMPALPEWDREKYPYAFISHSPANSVVPTSGHLYLASKMEYAYNRYDKWSITGNFAYHFGPTDPEYAWYYRETEDGTPAVSVFHWANVDLLNSDGTVYLYATAPIPVCE